MLKLKISVIIPSFNPDINHLILCLESINSSTLKPYEVILVDDKSTISYFEEIKPYCKIIKNSENHGPAYARNRGAKEAKGDILCFIDSDVLIKSDTLKKISEKFKDKKVSAVQTIYSKSTPILNFISQYQNLYGYYIFNRIDEKYLNSISSHCIAVRKEAFFDVNGFDEGIKNTSVEDENLGISLSSKNYNILLTKDIEVEHLAYFNLKKLLKRMFRIASAKVEYAFKKPETRKMNLKKTHHSINLVISILLSPLFILFPLLKLPIIFLLLLFLLVNLNFLKFIAQNKGVIFMLKSMIIYYLVCLTIFLGFIKGGIGYISK